MLLDKNGKIKGKISIVDVAVIALVIVVIAGICVRYSSIITDSVKSDASFRYVLRIPTVRSYTVEALKAGDVVTDKKSDKILGKIVDVTSEPAKLLPTTADGRVIETIVPERFDCYVTVEATGTESESGYIMDDTTELSVGRYVDLYTQKCKTSGQIKSVEVIE